MGVVEVLDPVAPARAGGWKVDVSRGERNGRVSSEWFNRPDDERYLSLDDLRANVKGRSERSRSRVVQTADIRVEAARDSAERLHLVLPKAHEPVAPTHWAFGQLASIVGAPASYLRQLPAPLAGINLQYGLTNHRAEQVKTFETEDGRTELRAVTEPPRVYRRVVCSMTRRPYRVCSGLHRTPPLLLRVGCSQLGRGDGGCYTNRPISGFPTRLRASTSMGRSG